MDNGIAIVIPNVDFSENSLGKVNFIYSDEELAEKTVFSYIEKIGDDTYEKALYDMVYGLITNKIFENMDIYPILGAGNKKLINLNPNRGLQGVDLIVGDNAVLTGNNVITFDGDTAIGDKSALVTVKDNAPLVDSYVACKASRSSGYYLYKKITPAMLAVTSQFTSGIGQVFSASFSGKDIKSSDLFGTEKFRSIHVDSSNIKIYIENELNITEPHSTVELGWNNFIGGDYMLSSDTFGGTLNFFAKGTIPTTKQGIADEIFKAFTDVKV